MKTTPYFFLLLTILLSIQNVSACSMFKITKGGKTMVGNNEDYWNPNTRLWFEQGGNSKFGAMYVGFDNLYPQGGMNEAGLVFDGFSMDYMAVTDTVGKKSIGSDQELFSFTKTILQTCSKVTEVKDFLSKYNLESFHSSLLFFVDKSGQYLIMEGNALILGNDPTYIQSNFYPSCTKDANKVNIPFYQKGRNYLKENPADTSLAYCRNMMNAMHQDFGEFGGSLYTTIYDLENGKIHLYYHFDFETVVTFDLNEELKKENRLITIPELFPKNNFAQKQLELYNETIQLIQLLDNPALSTDSIKLHELIAQVIKIKPDFRFESEIDAIGYMWMKEYEDIEIAIQVLQLNSQLYPKSSNVYDSLGEAYLKNGQTKKSRLNYKKSRKLAKRNSTAKAQSRELKKSIKKQKQTKS
jgi:hypothetical protein